MYANPGKLFVLHIFVFIVTMIAAPIHLVASFFKPLFGYEYKKWLDLYLPSYSGYVKFVKHEWKVR